MKNLRKGARRFRMVCSTRMSTQLWWLLMTRYQDLVLRPSSPLTRQRVRLMALIQAPLTLTQPVAMLLSAWSHSARTALIGSRNLIRANGSISSAPASVLRATSRLASTV